MFQVLSNTKDWVWQGSKYASANTFVVKRDFIKKDQRVFHSFFLTLLDAHV